LIILLFSAGGSVFGGGQSDDTVEDSSKLKVFVSVLPQTYFVEKIGGERVEVDVVVPPGKNPATYEPTPNQVAALSMADVLFTVGVPFENAFLPKISASLKSLIIADTSEGILKRSITEHHHDEEGHDEDAADDPHIWLSPLLAKVQADTIHRMMVELDPQGRELYDRGLAGLKAELDDLHAELLSMLEPYKGRTLFIFHPTLGYFADEYGLEQTAIEAGGKQPSAAALVEIIEHAREDDVRIIFVQPEFPKDSAELIAEAIGGSVVGLNPLNPDYVNNLRDIGESIRKSYE